MPSQSNQADVPIRVEATVRGWVQGVGFRQATLGVAQRFPVTGYVQNLPNGSVAIVVEGEATTIASFLAAVQHRMSRHIDAMDQHRRSATGEFDGFEIRYG